MSKNKMRKSSPANIVQKLLARTDTPVMRKEIVNAPETLIDEATAKKLELLVKTSHEENVVVKSRLNAAVDLACKIGETLILFGWAQDQENTITSVQIGGLSRDFSIMLHRYERPEINVKLNIANDEHKLGFLLLVNLPKAAVNGTLTLQAGHDRAVINYHLNQELKSNPIFNTYFGEMLSLADSQGFETLYETMSKFAVPVNRETAIRAAVDYCYWMPGGVIFTTGWAFSLDAEIVSMEFKIAGLKYDLYEKATLIPREDLKHGFTEIGNKAKTAGFVGCVKTQAKQMPTKINVKITSSNKDIYIFEVSPKALNDRQEFSKIALSYVDINKDGFKRMFDQHLGETLQIGLKDFDRSQFLIKQKQYGEAPTKPKVTVIVPLYGRIDFIKYQLSQFADDVDFQQNVELIYVLDDPKLESVFFRYCTDHAPLFRVPFKAVSYGMNLGYAGANNVAASLASADHLLLLNSDVMPDSRGWVSHLLKEYLTLKDAGAIAPKLLYEDGSIQHAGMEFEQLAVIDDMWSNTHPGKGMPDTEPVSNTPTQVPAVTGACLMISKTLYNKIGGLDEQYYLGDFEDSDLCLKLIELGKKNYYVSNLTLYHLERQSQSLFENNDWKTKVTIYNCWQHSKRWNLPQ